MKTPHQKLRALVPDRPVGCKGCLKCVFVPNNCNCTNRRVCDWCLEINSDVKI